MGISSSKKSGISGASARKFVFSLILLVLLTGCDKFDLTSVLNGKDGLPLTISPLSLVVPANEQITFTASGGIPPYTYSIVSGEGVIDSSSGAFVASMTPGVTLVRVTDDNATSQDAEIEVTAFVGSLVISPSTTTLNTGATANPVFSGTWPSTPGTYCGLRNFYL